MKKIIVFPAVALAIAAAFVACTSDVEPLDVEKIPLTAAQQNYIATTTATVCHSISGKPFQWTDAKGDEQGISVDYMKLTAAKIGLKLKFLPMENQAAAIEAFRLKKCDLLAAVKPLPERDEFVDYTPPYILVGTTMLVRGLPVELPLKVGYAKRYSVEALIDKLGKQMDIHSYPSNRAAYEALEKNEISAAVMDELTAGDIEKEFGRKYAHSSVAFVYDICFGYQKDNQLLGNLLSVTLANISQDEKSEIRSSNID